MTDPLAGKRVIILGIARQGKSLARWLCGIGAEVIMSDVRPADKLAGELDDLAGLPIRYELGGHPLAMLEGADLLCVSGGVPLTLPIIREALQKGIPLSNDAQVFIERCPCPVIGITGSAGKTTTTSMVGEMCRAAGLTTWVGGNIGNPMIDDLDAMGPNDIAVMELSSFQLELMTVSPAIGAILNLTPNHLDRHGTMEYYIAAKTHIIEHQGPGDVAVLNYDDANTQALRNVVKPNLSEFSGRVPVKVGAWLVGDHLVCRPAINDESEIVCKIKEIPLRGYHNTMNTLAACAITGAVKVATGGRLEVPIAAMRVAILDFKAVPHRLETVREIAGVTYINDSIATAPERVLAALKAFSDEPVILLLGGRDKMLPWEEFLEFAVPRLKAVVTFGEAGLMIAQKAAKIRDRLRCEVPIEQCATMEEAIMLADEMAKVGDTILLSPGCTSFDAYRDFAERGEAFRRTVMSL